MRSPSPSFRSRAAALAAAVTLAVALWFSIALAGNRSEVRRGESARRERPVVLLVHGRGLLDRDSTQLRGSWRRALQRGASALTGATVFADDDVRLVWYADLLDPESPADCAYGAGDRRSRRTGGDSELRSVISMLGLVLESAAPLVDGQSGGIELRALAGDLSYLADAGRRCAVERRLDSAITIARSENRPVILVAHSLGSLVAYDMLASASPGDSLPAIERLVTIGAPVGSPELRALLYGAQKRDSLVLPRGVKSWVNVLNPADPLAARLGDSLPNGLHDLTTSSSDQPDAHDVIAYLRDPVTARAILEAFCSASAFKPKGCEKL